MSMREFTKTMPGMQVAILGNREHWIYADRDGRFKIRDFEKNQFESVDWLVKLIVDKRIGSFLIGSQNNFGTALETSIDPELEI